MQLSENGFEGLRQLLTALHAGRKIRGAPIPWEVMLLTLKREGKLPQSWSKADLEKVYDAAVLTGYFSRTQELNEEDARILREAEDRHDDSGYL